MGAYIVRYAELWTYGNKPINEKFIDKLVAYNIEHILIKSYSYNINLGGLRAGQFCVVETGGFKVCP